MEIVALRAITSGEEITVPYLDPALPLQTRQSALRANYGFNCMCPLCTFQQTLGPVVPLPSDSKNIRAVEDSLCEYVTSHILQLDPYGIPPSAAETSPGSGIPSELFCLLNADYLPSLSETFSRSSHEGNYEIALASGRTLLAFYAAIYPRNYPQIGENQD
ncbi:hypothetical protein PHLCEN_2v12390 [Hermanssonia centrifuga]|uniref:SET domain-containing protein n=1 Tax=Hermanssonia centrifuga TaxID=98765 RepID=A0A2R6NIF2_9APHY|nr:hypothetical protein PHLCEN_2v12390 [Hermanssonia centrifuga]